MMAVHRGRRGAMASALLPKSTLMGRAKMLATIVLSAFLLLCSSATMVSARKLSYHNEALKPQTSLDGHVVTTKMRQVLRDQMMDPTSTEDGTTQNYQSATAQAALASPSQPSSAKDQWPTYLSATVVITLGPVDGVMDSARQAMLSMAVTLFLEKIFEAQSEYDISVRSVGVIEQGLSIVEGGSAQPQINRAGNRHLRSPKQRHLSSKNMAVEVESVITAQYYRTDASSPIISTEDFGKMLEHVFDKFEVNLVDILKEQEGGEDWKRQTPYFESIEFASIAVRTGGSTKGHMPGGVGVSTVDSTGSGGTSKAVGITALALSGVAVLAMSVAVFRRRNTSQNPKMAVRYTPTVAKEPNEDTFNIQSIARIGREDNYSFSSQKWANPGISVPSVNSFTKKHVGKAEKKSKKRNKNSAWYRNGVQTITFEDKISAYDLSTRLGKSKRDDMSVASTTSSSSKKSKEASYTRIKPTNALLAEYGEMDDVAEEETLATMRNECYAPPGKLGVAIDTVNGQPVVHRIKEGSPLKGMLQHKDRIVAIDGVDTRNMTAADVTHLMVKGMNRVRKISYVRSKRVSSGRR